MLWIITLSLPIIFVGLLSYLLKDWILSLDWTQLKVGDIASLVGVGVALLATFIAVASFFVAVSQLIQAVADGREQAQALDASRKQLQSVVDAVKAQQQIMADNLETSRQLFTLQKDQQVVLAKSLETSKGLLILQQDQLQREKEIANRRPKIQLVIEDKIFDKMEVETSVAIGQENRGVLLTAVQNVGEVPLRKAVHLAIASNENVTIWFDGSHINNAHKNRTQLSGANILDILPVSTSGSVYGVSIHLIAPPDVSKFDVSYSVTGDNLDAPFRSVIHVNITR